MTVRILFGLIAMISCTVAANIFLKLGAGRDSSESMFMNVLNPKTLAGMSFFLFALLIYLWVLTKLPLNVAQSFAAAQFISVIIASSAILSEPIPLFRWLGIALIAGGIIVVGYSVDSNGQ